MKKIVNILILVALLAIIVVQLKLNKTTSENRIYQYDKEREIIVHSEVIKAADVTANHNFTGTFDANMDAKINADVQGKIVAYYVDAGSVVQKGQKLVRLDAALLKLQLQAVNVQIDGLKSDLKRYKVLSEADAIQGVKVEKTEMGLKSAIIQKNTLLETIKKTTIKAPFDGIVTMKMSEVGSFAAPGVPLLMLTNISELKFIVNVSERNLGLFKFGEKYKIRADAYPDLELEGTVSSVGSKGNMGNSFPIYMEIQNTKDLKIKSKMFGKVLIEDNVNRNSIVIPAASIIGSDLEPKVYLIREGKAVLQGVTVSQRIQNTVVINSGLKEGDILITSGFINLFEGANVKVKED